MTVVIRQSDHIKGIQPTVTADSAGDVIVNDYFYDLPAAQNLTGDIIDIGILPAYHTVSDIILFADDLDTGSAAMTLDVGLMSGTPGDTTNTRTCGAEFFAASTSAQASTVARPTLKTAFTQIATELDRSIGVKVLLQAATAAAGRVRLRVFMHASDHKTQF